MTMDLAMHERDALLAFEPGATCDVALVAAGLVKAIASTRTGDRLAHAVFDLTPRGAAALDEIRGGPRPCAHSPGPMDHMIAMGQVVTCVRCGEYMGTTVPATWGQDLRHIPADAARVAADRAGR